MNHDKHMTASARAILAAGRHLQRKSSDDVIDVLAQKFGAHTDEVALQLKSIRDDMAGVRSTVQEIEQKGARGGGYAPQPQTWGAEFIASDGLKSFADEHSRPGRFKLELKTTITTGATSAGPLAEPARDSAALLPRRRLTIRDLLPVVQVSSNSIEWPSQTSRPGAAATVEEGAAKPQSTMAMELKTTPTQVIAHWVAASRQILDDAPQLRDLIDTELRYGLALVEETQLLTGDGTSPNLHGLIPQATAFADPLVGQITAPNQIDRIGSAILQSALADFPASGIVLHPSDWQLMRMLKDGENRYILGAPGTDIDPVLFGLPVVATKAIAAGSFLVGNFAEAATLYDRWSPRVEISTEHADFFTRNLVAILAEQRIALAVRKAAALVHGSFTDEVGGGD